MRKAEVIHPDTPVYRRIPGSHWYRSQNVDHVKAAALIDSRRRLSVYLSDHQTLRSILQIAIDKANGTGNNAFLERNGRTVEELVANRWRVVRIPLSSFTGFTGIGLTFDRIGGDGHLELLGDPTLRLKFLVDATEVLSVAECLAEPE